MGRPRIEITDDMIAETETLASQGLTKEQIAQCLGIGSTTLFEKQKEYPEFAESIKRGQALGIQKVTNHLFEQSEKGITTATIFYLKNRAPDEWKDRVPEGMGDDTHVHPVKIVFQVEDGRVAVEDNSPETD